MTRYVDPVAQAEIDRLEALLELSEQNEMQMGSRLVSAQAEIDRLEAEVTNYRRAWRNERDRAGLLEELIHSQADAISGLRAGEDASEKDPAELPTPGQLWHFLLEASEINRLRTLAKFQEAADEASRCFLEDHENRLADQ